MDDPVFRMTINIGEISFELGKESIADAIEDALRRHLQYGMQEIIRKKVEQWTTEMIEKYKAEVMAKIAPELDKQVQGIAFKIGRSY